MPNAPKNKAEDQSRYEPDFTKITQEQPLPKRADPKDEYTFALKATEECILEGGPKARMPVTYFQEPQPILRMAATGKEEQPSAKKKAKPSNNSLSLARTTESGSSTAEDGSHNPATRSPIATSSLAAPSHHNNVLSGNSSANHMSNTTSNIMPVSLNQTTLQQLQLLLQQQQQQQPPPPPTGESGSNSSSTQLQHALFELLQRANTSDAPIPSSSSTYAAAPPQSLAPSLPRHQLSSLFSMPQQSQLSAGNSLGVGGGSVFSHPMQDNNASQLQSLINSIAHHTQLQGTPLQSQGSSHTMHQTQASPFSFPNNTNSYSGYSTQSLPYNLHMNLQDSSQQNSSINQVNNTAVLAALLRQQQMQQQQQQAPNLPSHPGDVNNQSLKDLLLHAARVGAHSGAESYLRSNSRNDNSASSSTQHQRPPSSHGNTREENMDGW